MDQLAPQVKVWDWPLRLFHWTLVAAIAVAFLSSEEDSPINEAHVLAGWVAAILIVFRLVWGVIGGEHSRFSDFVRFAQIPEHIGGLRRRAAEPTLGHNPLGGLAVLVLLGLTAVTVGTGAFGGEAAEELHEVIAWALLAAIAVHIAAVVVMSWLGRENLVRAMISGRKPASRHPGARDARPPGTLALLAGLLVVIASAFAILRYDPQAFTLRSSEAFEHAKELASDAPETGRRDDE